MFKPGDKVVCSPVLPGLEDLVGRKGVVKQKLSETLYVVTFGRKNVRISDKEIHLDESDHGDNL